MYFPLAFMNDAWPFLIPLTALMIPIIAILVKHQQQMTQIIHGSPRNQPHNAEIDALRREIHELKQLVHQQAIAADSMRTARPAPESAPPRLTEVN